VVQTCVSNLSDLHRFELYACGRSRLRFLNILVDSERTYTPLLLSMIVHGFELMFPNSHQQSYQCLHVTCTPQICTIQKTPANYSLPANKLHSPSTSGPSHEGVSLDRLWYHVKNGWKYFDTMLKMIESTHIFHTKMYALNLHTIYVQRYSNI